MPLHASSERSLPDLPADRRGESKPIREPDFSLALQRQCARLAVMFGRHDQISLACKVTNAPLPPKSGHLFVRIARELVITAYHAFEPGQRGRISVSFETLEQSWELVIEHSGSMRRDPNVDASCWLAQRMADRLGAQVSFPEALGGARMVVTLTRANPVIVKGAGFCRPSPPGFARPPFPEEGFSPISRTSRGPGRPVT